MATYPGPLRRARIFAGIAIICSLLAAAPLDQKKKQKNEPPSPTPVIPDQILAVDDGRFVFRSLRFVQEYSTVFLAGTVTNDTSHDWEDVSFDLRWTDSVGGTGTLVGRVFCFSFPRRGECSLALGGDPGIMILGLPQNPYTAQFFLKSGHYVPSYTFSLQKPKTSEALVFEDSKIAFIAQVSRQGIAVAILNKTDQPIKIDWNQVSYIDQTGKANGVTHEGVKYADATNAKPPTVIPPGARHEDMIVPAGSIRYANGWKVNPLLPMGAQSRELVGKTISLYVPMEISGRVENYSIGIRIESAN